MTKTISNNINILNIYEYLINNFDTLSEKGQDNILKELNKIKDTVDKYNKESSENIDIKYREIKDELTAGKMNYTLFEFSFYYYLFGNNNNDVEELKELFSTLDETTLIKLLDSTNINYKIVYK